MLGSEHLVADFDAISAHVDGNPARLTCREFQLLEHLVENRNRVLSRDRLFERVWGYDRFIEVIDSSADPPPCPLSTRRS